MKLPSISQALRYCESHGLDRLDAQLLLLHVLGRPAHQRGWLLAHANDLIDSTVPKALVSLVKRRAAGEPLAYITGHKEFFGLNLQVDARVLVPRPDTETLVEWALTLLPRPLSQAWGEGLLDLGTGSGAVALAVKSQRPDLRVTALDVSADALAVARSNAEQLHLEMHFRQGAWLQGIDERFQIIVSNPPYIAAHDQHLDALSFEPTSALVSGTDGLHDIRQIIAQSPGHLIPGGWLLLEHGYDQASAVRHLMKQAGFEQVQSRRDLAGVARCSGGCMATSPATGPGFQ